MRELPWEGIGISLHLCSRDCLCILCGELLDKAHLELLAHGSQGVRALMGGCAGVAQRTALRLPALFRLWCWGQGPRLCTAECKVLSY